MVNRNKAKGTAFNTEVSRYLQRCGFYMAENRTQKGALDEGDVGGIEHVVIETKHEKEYRLSAYLKEANDEARNKRAHFGFAWFKKRGTTDPGDYYVLMDGRTVVQLLIKAGYGPWRKPETEE